MLPFPCLLFYRQASGFIPIHEHFSKSRRYLTATKRGIMLFCVENSESFLSALCLLKAHRYVTWPCAITWLRLNQKSASGEETGIMTTLDPSRSSCFYRKQNNESLEMYLLRQGGCPPVDRPASVGSPEFSLLMGDAHFNVWLCTGIKQSTAYYHITCIAIGDRGCSTAVRKVPRSLRV